MNTPSTADKLFAAALAVTQLIGMIATAVLAAHANDTGKPYVAAALILVLPFYFLFTILSMANANSIWRTK